jgi:hypothetical protein
MSVLLRRPRGRLHAGAAIAVLCAATCALALPHPAAADNRAHATELRYTECQHPVRTGVEVYRLHRITSRRACPVALALFRWEAEDSHELRLYGCHGIGHPYLKMHTFDRWHLKLAPDFVMSRHGASFAVGGTDFPINCS